MMTQLSQFLTKLSLIRGINAQSLSFNSSDLTSVIISGELADVTFDGDGSGVNLTNPDSITITADMDDLVIDDVDDLTSLIK